jgi:hypothetical protein
VFTPGKLILAVPLNDTPPIFLAVCNAVAVAALPEVEEEVEAFPLKEAVIVPAVKLPEPSLATIAPPVFPLVALEVTVKVPPSLETEPEIPVPEVAPAAT